MSPDAHGSGALPRVPLANRGITLGGLLRCFLVIGVTGFGGVLPVVVHEIVTRRRWLDTEEFTEILAICQVLPGPNIINISIVMGMRVSGWPGAITALSGLLILPVAMVLTLGALYTGFAEVPAVQSAVRAVAAAAAGLVCAVTARLFWPQRRNPVVVLLGLVIVAAVAWARLPLVVVIAVFAPLSIGLTLWRMRHHE